MKVGKTVMSVAALATLLSLSACGADGNTRVPTLATAENLTSQYVVEPWTDTAMEATDLAFLPDGRALVTTKGGWGGPGVGEVKLFDGQGRFEGNALELPVCSDAERGLLAIEVDPRFETQPFVYLYFTQQMADCYTTDLINDEPLTQPVWNRLSRFTYSNGALDPASEQVLIDEIAGHQSSHNGGGLAFVDDDVLVLGTGEGTLELSRDVTSSSGKILRINVREPESVPSDNPFATASDPVEALVFASGLRNPFRVAADPTTGLLVAADVGTDEFEEINVIQAGGDYGFPDVEGPSVVDGTLMPTFSYPHENACSSVIGGEFVDASFVPGSDRPWYTFSDLGCPGVWAIAFDGIAVERVVRLADNVGIGLASLVAGPDGALYLVSIGSGAGPVLRLSRR